MSFGGCTLPPSNDAKSSPSTKYSQTLGGGLVVSFHGRVTWRPVVVRGQGLDSSSRIAWPLPPEHCIEPLGASTDCGSYLMEPQSKDVAPVAHWSCRLG